LDSDSRDFDRQLLLLIPGRLGFRAIAPEFEVGKVAGVVE
jgi:hypothetical protein